MNGISVIIPNYNRGAIIGETIENMLSQTLSPHEIIVVDDGSTDNSIDTIKKFGDKIKLIQQSNKGPGAARNAGLKVASCKYIQFMDSDDLVSLNKLEIQLNTLLQTNADIVYGPWVKIWKHNSKISLQDVVLQQDALPTSKTPLKWFLTEWSMVFQHCLVKKEIVQKVGGYREDLYTYEDGDLFIKILLAGGKLVYESQSLTFYRLNDFGKLTSSGLQNAKRTSDLAEYYSTIIDLRYNHPNLKSSTDNFKFKVKVWKAMTDLKLTQPEKKLTYDKLRQFSGTADLPKKTMLWYSRIINGLVARIKGHRWSIAFKARKLTADQERLIIDLGWQLNNRVS